ncbi:MAG: sigma-70 family RNA polymerase sigma factor [Bacteroidota bacterium]
MPQTFGAKTGPANLEKQPTILKEKQLIADCLAGKRQAQRQLYKDYYNQVLGVCLRYAKDRLEAKGLVNTAFLKAFKSLSQYKGQGVLGAWLTRIAINACIDEVRKHQNYRNHTASVECLPETSFSESILDALAAEDILKCLQQISPRNRTVFSLFVIDGYKHQEIADLLGISVGTSRWHLSEAKKEMKILLKKQLN